MKRTKFLKKMTVALAFAIMLFGSTTQPVNAASKPTTFAELKASINNERITEIEIEQDLTNVDTTDLGILGCTKLIVGKGSRRVIDAVNASNLYYSAPTELTIKNLSFQNFDSDDTGGVINNGGPITIAASDFISNMAGVNGGVIYNIDTATINNSAFKGNEAIEGGGAIYNVDTLYITDSTFGEVNEGNYAECGGAIYNIGKATITTSIFKGNESEGGGAVYNEGTLDIANSTFGGVYSAEKIESNSAYNGGAIYNADGAIATIKDSKFIGNEGSSQGGAIYNDGDITVTNSTFGGVNTDESLEGNTASEGGAIYNASGKTATITNSTFTGNIANDGGAIANAMDSTITISDSQFISNTSIMGGSAIINQGTLDIINSTFENNQNTDGMGGTIFNYATGTGATTIKGSKFISNYDITGGAAITNTNTIEIIDSIFEKNSSGGVGGAILNMLDMNYSGTNIFKNNIADGSATGMALGGAIYNADTGNMTFSGTTIFENNSTNDGVNEVLNDIHNSGTLTFTGGETTFHGGITADDLGDGSFSGSTALNGTIKIKDNYAGETTMYQNELIFGTNGVTTLDMRNNAINTLALGTSNLEFFRDVNLLLDADLVAKEIDTITSNGAVTTSGHTINISGVRVIADAPSEEAVTTSNSVTNNPDLLAITKYTGEETVDGYSPIYKYDVTYNNDGTFTFARRNGGVADAYNPAVLTSSVAVNVGSYLTALNSYDNAFNSLDNFMNMTSAERFALKNRNVYAINDSSTIKYNDNGYRGIWFNPYASFENIKLNNGPSVTSTSYGSYFGGDSDIISLKNGWDSIYSVYVGYTGSHQNYQDVGIYQNGGVLGTSAVLYKGNYFLGSTINVGASNAQANNLMGHEDFTTLNSGVAVKTGYNFEFKEGSFILQPSMLMSYTFVNTFDYKNAWDVEISSKPMHAINLAPGLKFIWNLKNGWQPYLSARMVWNIMDKTNFTATYAGQSTRLPQMSIDPYFQYGLGVKKTWGERLTGFAQAMLNAGGRNGIALQFGFKIKLGKESV